MQSSRPALQSTQPKKRQQDLKQGRAAKRIDGLGPDEDRNWRGFHHHANLAIAAYGFLIAECCLLPHPCRFARERIVAPARPRVFKFAAPPIRAERPTLYSEAGI